MTEASDRCSFEFNPKSWEQEHDGTCFVDPSLDEDILTENAHGDMVWRCPYEDLDDKNRCLFHLPQDSDAKPDAKTVTNAFLDIVNGEREPLYGDGLRLARFIGAKFNSLDLNVERIGGRRSIDLRHADIKSTKWKVGIIQTELLDARGVRVRGEWNCEGVILDGDVRFDGAEFGGDVWFDGAEFGGDVRFDGAEFDRKAVFNGTEFHAGMRFYGSRFGGDFLFRGGSSGGNAYFDRVVFVGETRFDGAVFDGNVQFKRAKFGEIARFDGTHFTGVVRFRSAKFDKEARFSGTDFGAVALFISTVFGAVARFDETDFEEGAEFVSDRWFPISQFQDNAHFAHVSADSPLRFVGKNVADSGTEGPITFLADVDFSHADIPYAEFSEVSFREAPTFKDADLTRADFSDCAFKQATFEGANLSRADFSELDLSGAGLNNALLSQASLYGTDLTNARLYGARMDGAHISDHTDFGVRDQVGDQNRDKSKRSSAIPFRGPWPGIRYDKRNPEYDQFADGETGEDAEGGESISDHTRAAAVYAEIERVARANGDSELASRCYRWRKDMQRKRYWGDEGRGNRPERIRWARSWLVNAIVRYGESPWRVTGIAGLIIVGCAILYYGFDLIEYSTSPIQSALLTAVGGTPPNPVIRLLDAFYFSTLTFSTLGMGTFQPSGPVGRTVAIFETLSGVVLLALLVFVFGRRATR